MNSVVLVGRIVKNLELRTTSNNKSVCSFTIAVRRDNDTADFINCIVFGNQAENLCKYKGKGSQIGIIGSLRVDKYQDGDGNNKYKTYVLVNQIKYLDSKNQEKEKSNSEIIRDVVQDKDIFEDFGNEVQFNENDLPF